MILKATLSFYYFYDELTYSIHTLFAFILVPPKILRVTPTGGATIGVHNRSILTCSAEGNPLPKYQWLQKLPSQQVIYNLFCLHVRIFFSANQRR